MKIVVSLALFFACALGVWAINDYRINEQMKRDFVRQGMTTLDFRLDSGKTGRLDTIAMCSYYERHDDESGALSFVCLVGSIAYSGADRRPPAL
ncbi:MAG TPA: hypothetical protein VMD25_06690 [Acidobacteriaceae bacterium]|nr:hypothetical protein [Acidobacteriaceae bacterium]